MFTNPLLTLAWLFPAFNEASQERFGQYTELSMHTDCCCCTAMALLALSAGALLLCDCLNNSHDRRSTEVLRDKLRDGPRLPLRAVLRAALLLRERLFDGSSRRSSLRARTPLCSTATAPSSRTPASLAGTMRPPLRRRSEMASKLGHEWLVGGKRQQK